MPFSYWVVQYTKGIDVRTIGSGNPGATNVLRAAGSGAALTVLALDILKGAVPVVLTDVLRPGSGLAAWAALGAVCGHVFSVFLGLRGGKGVATAAGALGAFSLPALGVGALLFAGIVASTRFVSLASIVGASTFPLTVWALGGRGWRPELVPVTLIAVLVVFRHRANIGRLMAGTESRLGRGRRSGEGDDPS